MIPDLCQGPNPNGGCPRASDDGSVYCAGRQVKLCLADGRTAVWTVEAGAQACFVTASGLVITNQPLEILAS